MISSSKTVKKLKCQECGIYSKDVNHSGRMGKKLCFDCLRELMLKEIKDKPQPKE